MKKRMTACIAGCFLLGLTVQAAEYRVDPSHTTVGFTVRHMGISSVRGQFGEYDGVIHYDGTSIEQVAATGTVKAASIDTANEKRDEHLRSADFFDVEQFPEIRFESARVVRTDSGYVLEGNFTMHGVTKPVRLDMTLEGPIQDPWSNQRIGMALATTVNRHDFGVAAEGATDRLIGKEVRIEINLEATAN